MLSKLRSLLRPKPLHVFEDGSALCGSLICLRYIDKGRSVRLPVELGRGKAVIFSPYAIKVWDEPYDAGVIGKGELRGIAEKVEAYFLSKGYNCETMWADG